MLSTLCFIPKGAAKEVPEQYELSKAEIDMLVEQQSGMSLEERYPSTVKRLVPVALTVHLTFHVVWPTIQFCFSSRCRR